MYVCVCFCVPAHNTQRRGGPAQPNKENTNPSPHPPQLMNLQRRFPAFDPDGKTIYLNNLDGLADRMNVFVTRMRLSDDASSRAWLHTLNVQLLEAGLSVDTLAAGLKASTDMMRRWVEEEAAVAHDPAARAALRSKLEAYFDAAPDVEALLADPAVAPALADPLVLAALRDAVADLDAAEKNYSDNPAVAAMLRRLREGRKGR